MTDKQENKQLSVSHKIIKISLVNWQVFVPENEKINKDKVGFAITIKFEADKNTKSVKVEANFKIYSDETQSLLVAEMDTIGVFEIQNFEEIINAHNGNFPTVIIMMFTGIVISTSRGFYILKS